MVTPERSSNEMKIQTKTREFRLATIGLFFISAVPFAELYCTQGVLPQIAEGLGVSAGDSQLTVLAATSGLAVGMIPASLLSERRGRRNMMLVSAVLAVLVGAFMPFCRTFTELLALEGLQGFLLAGIPAVAMAYVSEEFDSSAIMPATGVYVAGGAASGLVGRVLPTWVAAETDSWRWALGAMTALMVVCAVFSIVLLPHSRSFVPSAVSYAKEARMFLSHLADPRLIVVFLLVFCLMGAYVSVYNSLPFHMESPPFNMSPKVYGIFFFVNLVGVFSSRLAGSMVAKTGVRRTLLIAVAVMFVGVLLLFPPAVAAIVLGTILITGGGFAGHTCLTGLIAKIVDKGRAQAATLYMASFYGGSAITGLIGSRVFTSHRWEGLVVYVGVLMVLGFALVLTIREKAQRESS